MGSVRMGASLCLLVLACLLWESEAGLLLTKLSEFGDRVKCKVHQVGNLIATHEHRQGPCIGEKGQDTVEDRPPNIDIRHGDSKPSSTTTSTTERQNVRPSTHTTTTSSSTTDLPTATVPGGKRLIKAGANCPDGQVYVDGSCKDEY